MPDREKYIEVLSKTVKTAKEFNDETPIKISLECTEDILDLLKEQDAVEPKLDIDAFVCGNCGHGLIHQELLGEAVLFEERYNYCPQCGRAVKWDV